MASALLSVGAPVGDEADSVCALGCQQSSGKDGRGTGWLWCRAGGGCLPKGRLEQGSFIDTCGASRRYPGEERGEYSQ